jgi:hypothetical protein
MGAMAVVPGDLVALVRVGIVVEVEVLAMDEQEAPDREAIQTVKTT